MTEGGGGGMQWNRKGCFINKVAETAQLMGNRYVTYTSTRTCTLHKAKGVEWLHNPHFKLKGIIKSSEYAAFRVVNGDSDLINGNLWIRWIILVISLHVLSRKIEWIFTLFVTDVTPWVVTSVITSFGVNIEWTVRDSTRWVVNFHSTGVRIEWISLLNEWNLFTPSIIHSISFHSVYYSLDFFFGEFSFLVPTTFLHVPN